MASFVLLLAVAALFHSKYGQAAAGVAALWWIVISTSGRLLSGVESSAARIAIVLAVMGLILRVVRVFSRQVESWVFAASVISIIATLGQVAVASVRNPDPEPFVAVTNVASQQPEGSFYFIVLDGYGDPIDNDRGISKFFSGLEREGFSIATDAISNYSYTHASISNVLSLDHRFAHGSASVAAMFNAIQGSNQMRSLLERAGFRYVHIESGWAGSRCGPTVRTCVQGRFLDGFVWQTLQMTSFTDYIEDNVHNPYVQGGLHSLDALARHGREVDAGKDFVFAHIVLPHPPIQLDDDCNLVIDPGLQGQVLGVPGMSTATRQFREAGYRGQRACINEMVLSTIADLPSDASVVITADHGTDFLGQLVKEPKDWSAADIEERFRIFHAARLPNPCGLPVERDLVNLVRAEVSCIASEALPALAPYHEITPYFTTDFEVRVLLDSEIP
ncbi:MAG: hypothetical protein ACRDWA_14835 [Acidimicrobiia bacterium]